LLIKYTPHGLGKQPKNASFLTFPEGEFLDAGFALFTLLNFHPLEFPLLAEPPLGDSTGQGPFNWGKTRRFNRF
jgi:hypothetical protein